MYVGVDIGTQSLKAVACDIALAVKGAAAVSYEPAFPRPGWAEQHPDSWWDAAARRLPFRWLRRFPSDASQSDLRESVEAICDDDIDRVTAPKLGTRLAHFRNRVIGGRSIDRSNGGFSRVA